MTTCLFLTFRYRIEPPADELAKLERHLRTMPNLAKGLIHTSSNASDPYVKDGAPPSMVLQLYFPHVHELEAALSRSGHLEKLTAQDTFPALGTADVTQQAMLVRRFAVPDPARKNAPERPYFTYLVSYEGEAEDLNAWHGHYLEKHTSHMAMFPEIRELEVYTRLDWVSGLPWPRVHFMQRNKVAFDSPEALTHALNSPVRHEMRADFRTFPKFSGPNNHYAMATRIVEPML
jgi:hypothetical protein